MAEKIGVIEKIKFPKTKIPTCEAISRPKSIGELIDSVEEEVGLNFSPKAILRRICTAAHNYVESVESHNRNNLLERDLEELMRAVKMIG